MSIYQKVKRQLLSQENASPRVVEATPEAGVGRVVDDKIVDATLQSHAEVLQVATESELINDEVEVLVAEHQGLDKVHQAVEDTLAEGGLNPQAASVVDAAMEAMAIRIGIRPTVPSSESFGSQSDRMAMTRLSIEAGFKETAKKIWEAIKNLFIKAKDAVLKFFGFKKKTAEDFKARFEAIAKKAGETKGTAKADAKGPETDLFRNKSGSIKSAGEISKFLESQVGVGKSFKTVSAALADMGKINFEADTASAELMKAAEKLMSEGLNTSYSVPTSDIPDLDKYEKINKDTVHGVLTFNGKVVWGANTEDDMQVETSVYPGDKVEVELQKDANNVKKISEGFTEALKDILSAEDLDKKIGEFFDKLISVTESIANKATDTPSEEDKARLARQKKDMEIARKAAQKMSVTLNAAWLGGLKGTCEYLEKSLEAFEEKSDS